MAGLLAGRTVVVTGATSGIGLETAIGLARLGAAVSLVARDPRRGELALEQVRTASSTPPRLFLADFASLAEVRRLASELASAHPRIEVLVNNAGAIHMTRKETVDGFEMTLAVNHLAPFLLTNLLLPALKAGAPSRVVTVASEAHRSAQIRFDDLDSRRDYAGFAVYSRSKLANILFASELSHRLEGVDVTSNSLHPGVVATRFGQNDPGFFRLLVTLGRPFLTRSDKGARTSIHLAAAPELAKVSGRYFKNSREARPSKAALDLESQGRLWRVSSAMVGLVG
jgi:NAD(P)-dependent dehydrogenase (short-subunit alcohol dehydrogenase family)